MPAAEESSQKARVLEDLNFSSDRLSTEVREISLGLLALVWALLVGEVKLNAPDSTRILLVIAAVAVLTMLFDFLQYLGGYFASRRTWEDLRLGGDGRYHREWWSHRVRRGSFGVKIVLCFANCVAMLALLASLVM